jgi:hypothetical protein
MSYKTLTVIIETIKEMQQCGLSNSFIRQQVPEMFELTISEDVWSEIL